MYQQYPGYDDWLTTDTTAEREAAGAVEHERRHYGLRHDFTSAAMKLRHRGHDSAATLVDEAHALAASGQQTKAGKALEAALDEVDGRPGPDNHLDVVAWDAIADLQPWVMP